MTLHVTYSTAMQDDMFFKIRGTCNSFHFNQRIRNMAYNGVFDDSTISTHDYDAHVEKILHSGDTYKTMHRVVDVLLWLQKNDCDWQSKISGQRKTLIQRFLQDGMITPLARFYATHFGCAVVRGRDQYILFEGVLFISDVTNAVDTFIYDWDHQVGLEDFTPPDILVIYLC